MYNSNMKRPNDCLCISSYYRIQYRGIESRRDRIRREAVFRLQNVAIRIFGRLYVARRRCARSNKID